MIVKGMKGSQRATLIRSLGHLLRNTKAAIGTNAGCFLPTDFAKDQVEKIEVAKGSIPRGDADAVEEFELGLALTEISRNAVVLHARIIDKKIRQPEKEEGVPTSESDALMEDLQTILRALGDDRDLESTITRKKNGKAGETESDPTQMDLVEEAAG